MGKIFVKQLGTCLLDNEENKELLIKLGLKKDDTKDTKRPSQHADIDIKRVSKRRDTK